MQTLKEFIDKSSFSLFHLTACSLSKNKDDLEHLIQSTKIDFDIIAATEWRIIKNKPQQLIDSHQTTVTNSVQQKAMLVAPWFK